MVARLLAAAIAVVMGLGVLSSASAENPSKAVEAAYRAWDEAFGRQDAAALGNAYAPDALFLAPDHEIRKGSKAIETFFEGLFKAGVTDHRITLIEAGGEGKTVYGTARWRASVKGEDGKPKEIGGIATHIFERRADGSLKLKVHGFN